MDSRRLPPGGAEPTAAPAAAAGGREALARLTRASFSLVVTDLKMPDMTGLDVLRAARRLGVPVPVIVMTADGSVEKVVIEEVKRIVCA